MCVRARVLFFYTGDQHKYYVTFHPLTFLFLWLHSYTTTPSTPNLLLPLLSAPFEQTQMINRDLRKHGRGMVLAVGCQVKMLHACECVSVHFRAKVVGGRWTTEALNVYQGTPGGLV